MRRHAVGSAPPLLSVPLFPLPLERIQAAEVVLRLQAADSTPPLLSLLLLPPTPLLLSLLLLPPPLASASRRRTAC